MTPSRPTLAYVDAAGNVDTPEAMVAAFRASLRVGDVAGVTGRLAAVARRPAERDLLVDLLDAEGPQSAVERLQRFWCRTRSETVGLRSLGPISAEVYERVFVEGRDTPLEIVTLTRKINGSWQVVSSQNAPDYRPRLLVIRGTEGSPLDDVAFSRTWQEAHGDTAELVMMDGGGILGHPEKGWLGGVKGPAPVGDVVPEAALEAIRDAEGEASVLFEVSADAAPEREEQIELLTWLTQVSLSIAEHTGATHVYSPGADRLIPRTVLADGFSSSEPPLHKLATTWARLHRNDEGGYTQGLHHFHCPEVEYLLEDWGGPGNSATADAAARCAISVATAFISGKLRGSVGTVVRASSVRCHLHESRRGSEPGLTYGRLGAVRLVPLERQPISQSGCVPKV
ncbi:MAG: hypothetical protein AAGF12_08275 [Myxococcota bacterium]